MFIVKLQVRIMRVTHQKNNFSQKGQTKKGSISHSYAIYKCQGVVLNKTCQWTELYVILCPAYSGYLFITELPLDIYLFLDFFSCCNAYQRQSYQFGTLEYMIKPIRFYEPQCCTPRSLIKFRKSCLCYCAKDTRAKWYRVSFWNNSEEASNVLF